MELKTEAKEFWIFALLSAIVIALFSYAVFGLTGIRVFAGIIFVSLPFYLALNAFGLNEGEKFVFSMVMGFTLFSALVYWLGYVISFRLSILVIFAVFIIISFLIKKFKLKNKLMR